MLIEREAKIRGMLISFLDAAHKIYELEDEGIEVREVAAILFEETNHIETMGFVKDLLLAYKHYKNCVESACQEY